MFDWQLLGPGTGGIFYDVCDALEVKDGVSAPLNGWGMEHAIEAWGTFWKQRYYDQCKQSSFNI